MTPLRILLLAGACITIGAAASAGPGKDADHERAATMIKQIDPARGDRFAPVTRDQAIARASARFDRMDLNHDGVLTRDEFRQIRADRKAARADHFGPEAGMRAEKRHSGNRENADHGPRHLEQNE